MPHNRFFIDQDLSDTAPISLEGEEFHHFCVMRGEIGDAIELVNGKDQLLTAVIERIEKQRAIAKPLSLTTSLPKKRRIILAQALPLFNRLENLTEKATELGIDAFWLFPSLNSEKKTLSAQQELRLKKIAIAAMKQCGRLDLPEILLKPSLLEWKKIDGYSLFFGDTKAGVPRATPDLFTTSSILFVGPEKGWHERECSHLLEVLNARSLSLHDNILRTDTAAILFAGISCYTEMTSI
jgi:16S rRNA (uracil1498-N3)-methyltransferase